MIWTVMRIGLLRLWSNKVELGLALVVPILFFSLFAIIFSQGVGEAKIESIALAVIDEVDSETTRTWVSQLEDISSLESRQLAPRSCETDDERREQAQTALRDESVDLILWLAPPNPDADNEARWLLLTEGSDPVTPRILEGWLQANWLEHWQAPSVEAEAVAGETQSLVPALPEVPSREWSDALTGRQGTTPVVERLASESWAHADDEAAAPGESAIEQLRTAPSPVAAAVFPQPPQIETLRLFGDETESSKIAMYAAGIAVMFLLFSASGQGGSLLEEREAGTLERLLSSRLRLWQLLLGKWLYITVLGVSQLTCMFVWAQFVFGVDTLGHAGGFAVMALATAAASASLAMLLATTCRTRTQLNGVSVVLILAMSALGGSMVPRYLMSEGLQAWGQITFNAWAIDGFHKVFWQELPIASLGRELAVLWGMAVLLGGAAWCAAARQKY